MKNILNKLTIVTTLLLIILSYGCQKQAEKINEVTVAENISINEIKEWSKWYYSSIPNAPAILIEKFERNITNGIFRIRVPLSGSKGMIYFTKTNTLQAIFIRPNFEKQVDGKIIKVNTEFIDLNTSTYKVATYKNNVTDAIYTLTQKNYNYDVTTNGTFWFDLGCVLTFGIPEWSQSGERVCRRGIDFSWVQNMFAADSGGDEYSGGNGAYIFPGLDANFWGNPNWTDLNPNPIWGAGGGSGGNIGSISIEQMSQAAIDDDIANSNFVDFSLAKPRPSYSAVKNACLPPSTNCDWICVANTIGREVKDALIANNNTCATRISYALNYANSPISKTPKSFTGADNKEYIVGAQTMLAYLKSAYGTDPSNTIHLTSQPGTPLTLAYILSQLQGKQGIFVMIPNDTSSNGFNASGHVDLLNPDGSLNSGHSEYMFAQGGVKHIYVFLLN